MGITSSFQTVVSAFTAAAILAGCTSVPQPQIAATRPSETLAPDVMDWARKEVARREQVLADSQRLAAQQGQEIRRLQMETTRLTAELQAAQKAKQQAEDAAWVAQNKAMIAQEFTIKYKPAAQTLLEGWGFSGRAIDYKVDDVLLRDDVLYFSQVILWQKGDGSGGAARVTLGQDILNDRLVFQNIDETRNLTVAELRTLTAQESEHEIPKPAVPRPPEPSIWKPSNNTVNAGYVAAIGVIATGLGAWIKHAIESASNK